MTVNNDYILLDFAVICWSTYDLIHMHPNSYPCFIIALIHGYRLIFFDSNMFVPLINVPN